MNRILASQQWPHISKYIVPPKYKQLLCVKQKQNKIIETKVNQDINDIFCLDQFIKVLVLIQRSSGSGPDGIGKHFQLLARQEDNKFKTSLDNPVRPYLKIKSKKRLRMQLNIRAFT